MTTGNGKVSSGRRGRRFGASLTGLAVLVAVIAGLVCASAAYAASAPVVTHVSATGGPIAGGNTVTVTGKHFMSNGTSLIKKILFGSTTATHLHVVSATKLTVKAPSHSAGMVNVRVVSKSGAMSAKAKADRYTYRLPLPTITLLSPTSGPMAGGTSVTITGTDLADATAVTFGGLPATITADSATQITATAPAYTALVSNTNTTIFVLVTTAAGTSDVSMFNQYTYTAPTTSTGAPAVTGVADTTTGTPDSTVLWATGVATDSVTITGTGFTGATEVDFGGTGGTPATDLVVVSDTQITCTVPAGAGIVDVTVTTPNGTSGVVTNDWFEYSS